MTGDISPAAERKVLFVLDWAERLIILILFAGLAFRIGHALSGQPFNILALFSEGIIVVFIMIRRRAREVTARPVDWLAGMLGTMLPMMVSPGGAPLVWPVAGALIMLAGLTVSIWAKLSLQRSFGIAAANRGVIVEGPYRLVRHPMYAGYVLTQIGFLLINPQLWNLACYAAALVFQLVRIFAEERVLASDPAYVALMGRVRRRLIPGVF